MHNCGSYSIRCNLLLRVAWTHSYGSIWFQKKLGGKWNCVGVVHVCSLTWAPSWSSS
ncbi:hypothetical protein HK096_005702 [Nowakowskiella sp. JEL0078]|nr:hypothetical protein HK096_005702 [Nowakowskiella sp. JEL0078]